MYRLLKNAVLLSLAVLLSVWGWALYHQRESALKDKPDLTEMDRSKAKPQVTETPIQEKEPNRQPELNLNINRSSSDKVESSLEQGPNPEAPVSLTPVESAPASINELLPEKSLPKKYFKYGYEGKEEDVYNLNLGVEKDSVNVKLGVQTDKDRNTNVNSVDIEVKLPE